MLFDFIINDFFNYYLLYLRTNSYMKIHLFHLSFFIFVAILFSFFLIFISNPIYSVISLIVVYLFSAFILICFEIHFLAVVFILVYLGAVVVLFLFIVMMLNIKVQNTLRFFNVIPLIFFLFSFFFFLKNVFSFKEINFYCYMDLDLGQTFFDFYSMFKLFDIFADVEYLYTLKYRKENYIIFGFLLYNYFYFEIILASYILLLAMIGCITLTLVKQQKNKKIQEPMEQLLHKNVFFKRQDC